MGLSGNRRRKRRDFATVFKPTPQEILAAHGKKVADIIATKLKVLFCGINPGLYSGAVGHHFARPGNRFWPALYAAGFTPRLVSPFEERELLHHGLGITNIVARATAAADELTEADLRAGARRLAGKVRRYRPHFVAFLGISAYRAAFQRPKAALGRQEEKMGATDIWVLPNPSGLNAHYQLARLADMFKELRYARY